MRRQSLTIIGVVFSIIAFWGATAEAQNEIPVIASISPGVVVEGELLTIMGTNLVREGATTRVLIDETSVGYDTTDSGDLTVLVNTLPSTSQSTGEVERTVTVVVDGQNSDPQRFVQVSWRAVLKPRVWLALAVYLAIVGLIVMIFNVTIVKSETGQFSLSKIQMALWTFVFGLSYVALAAVRQEFLDITEGMFVLMGISSATAVGAKAIVLKNLDGLDKNHSSGLLTNWDKDSQSYRLSLHRSQIALWTAIVLVTYVLQLIETMRLPEIPTNLLVLMGIILTRRNIGSRTGPPTIAHWSNEATSPYGCHRRRSPHGSPRGHRAVAVRFPAPSRSCDREHSIAVSVDTQVRSWSGEPRRSRHAHPWHRRRRSSRRPRPP